MPFQPDHDLHKRRLSRNLGLGGALLLFVVLVFGITIAKVQTQDAARTAPHAPTAEAGK